MQKYNSVITIGRFVLLTWSFQKITFGFLSDRNVERKKQHALITCLMMFIQEKWFSSVQRNIFTSYVHLPIKNGTSKRTNGRICFYSHFFLPIHRFYSKSKRFHSFTLFISSFFSAYLSSPFVYIFINLFSHELCMKCGTRFSQTNAENCSKSMTYVYALIHV